MWGIPNYSVATLLTQPQHTQLLKLLNALASDILLLAARANPLRISSTNQTNVKCRKCYAREPLESFNDCMNLIREITYVGTNTSLPMHTGVPHSSYGRASMFLRVYDNFM